MAGLLLDTHILVRWLVQPGRISREQRRLLNADWRREERLAISAITLFEVAQMGRRPRFDPEVVFAKLDEGGFQTLPLTVEIAREAAALGPILRDPADCLIVATARMHGLRLLTSDERITTANVVSTVS